MEGDEIAHLAGLVDGVGSISGRVSKHDEMAVGYQFRALVIIPRHKSDEAMLGKLDAYATDNQVRYTTQERENKILFRVSETESIKRFLEPLVPWLITRYNDATMMIDEIVPALQEGRDKEKEGFYQIVGFAEELNQPPLRERESKYTQEYFEEEWSLPST